MRADIAEALVALALLVVVLSAVGALVMRDTLSALHYVTPVTSLAAPLLGAALAVSTGWGITAGLDLLTVGLLAVTGPVLGASIGRTAAEREGILTPESPS